MEKRRFEARENKEREKRERERKKERRREKKKREEEEEEEERVRAIKTILSTECTIPSMVTKAEKKEEKIKNVHSLNNSTANEVSLRERKHQQRLATFESFDGLFPSLFSSQLLLFSCQLIYQVIPVSL